MATQCCPFHQARRHQEPRSAYHRCDGSCPLGVLSTTKASPGFPISQPQAFLPDLICRQDEDNGESMSEGETVSDCEDDGYEKNMSLKTESERLVDNLSPELIETLMRANKWSL